MSGQFAVAAEHYDRFMGRYSVPLAAAFADFAGLPADGRVLDVGAGPGALSAELAQRLGAERVAVVEPSAPFVAALRERLPGIEVVQASAAELPFGDGEIAAVLSQLVVNFLPDAAAGVREMARVTRAGGTVAACVWDYAGEMRLLRAFWDAAVEVEPARGAEADEGRRMRHCDQDELAALWEAGGLADVRTGALVVSAAYEDFDDLWAPLPAGVGPAGAFCASLEPDRRQALHDALKARLGVGDGPFALTARAWVVTGACGAPR